MKELKRKVSITLDYDLVDLIRDMANADDRSFSQLVNLVLRNYTNEHYDDYVKK